MNSSRYSVPVVSFIVALFCILLPLAQAEQNLRLSAPASALPDAPQPIQLGGQSSQSGSENIGTSNISGTVLDTRGDVVQGAQVQLVLPSGSIAQTKTTGSDGQFDFAALPAGSYKIAVSGNGMSTFNSASIELKPGEFRIVPTITLVVSGGATSVTVSGDKE